MNQVLLVAAHSDNEVLGCGGTITRHVDSGDQLQVLEVCFVRYQPDVLSAYASEIRSWPHRVPLGSLGVVEHPAGWRGVNVGFEAVESSYLLQQLR